MWFRGHRTGHSDNKILVRPGITAYAFSETALGKSGFAAVAPVYDRRPGSRLIEPREKEIVATNIDEIFYMFNHLARLSLREGSARWYVTEAWDQEGTENLILPPGSEITAKPS